MHCTHATDFIYTSGGTTLNFYLFFFKNTKREKFCAAGHSALHSLPFARARHGTACYFSRSIRRHPSQHQNRQSDPSPSLTLTRFLSSLPPLSSPFLPSLSCPVLGVSKLKDLPPSIHPCSESPPCASLLSARSICREGVGLLLSFVPRLLGCRELLLDAVALHFEAIYFTCELRELQLLRLCLELCVVPVRRDLTTTVSPCAIVRLCAGGRVQECATCR